MQYFLIILPAILIIATLLIINYFWSLSLNARSLARQPLFWLSILTPISLFLYFGYFAWSGHKAQLDSNGLNNFYSISKIPLLILASSVPLAAMVANLHRTIQTEAQINETKKKNSSDIYYSHFKFYTEAFSKIPSYSLEHKNFAKELSLNKVFKLYRETFPLSNHEESESHSTQVNEEYFLEIFNLWNDINIKIEEHNSEYQKYLQSTDKPNYPIHELHIILNEIELTLIQICKRLFISGYAYKHSAIYSLQPNSINPSGKKILHSGFFSHNDMCETIEHVEKICIKIMDIINPNCFSSNKDEFINREHWLSFKLFTTLNIRGYFNHMPYRQPEYLP